MPRRTSPAPGAVCSACTIARGENIEQTLLESRDHHALPAPALAAEPERGYRLRAWAPRLALLAAAALTAVDAIRALLLVGFRVVDEDLAIYWYAAQEFANLRFREPFFYGQAYHHLGESLIAAPFVAAGVPVWIAIPAISMAIGIAPWAILASLAWRRGALGLAVIFAGAPVLMPAGYQMLLMRPFGMGIMAVALALWIADSLASSARWILVGFLLALGVLAINNAALVAAPALAWLAFTSLRGRREWTMTCAGIACGAGLHSLGKLFYALHPGWVVHPSPRVEFSPALLADAVQNLPRHLGRVTPEALAHPAVPLVALLLLVIIGAQRRRWAVVGPAAAGLVATVAALGVGKVHDATPSVFFAYERMFLALPAALGVVALSASASSGWRGGATTRAAMVCAVGVLVLGSMKQATLTEDVASERRVPLDVLLVLDVELVRRNCGVLEAKARETGSDLAVFVWDNAHAYACGALAYGRLETLFPIYERRTWMLLQERARIRDRLLLVDVAPEQDCGSAERVVAGLRCVPAASNAAALRFTPRTTIDVLDALNVAVRPF